MIDHRIVSSLFSVISTLGLLANTLAVYFVFVYKYLHNTFGLLCAALAISNLGILLVFLVWCSFGLYLFSKGTMYGSIGKHIGQLALFLLDVKMYAHLGVSINRLFSLVFPFKYHSLESNSKVTRFYLSVTVVLAFLQIFPLFWKKDCYFIYVTDIAVWSFGKGYWNQLYFFYLDFLLSISIFCCILILDTISLLALRRALDFSNFSDNFKQKRSLEIGFLVQSLFQMVPSLFVYISFTFLSRFATTDWDLFITTTLVWVLLHAVDGVIMVIFQARRVIVRRRAKMIITVSTTNGLASMTTAPTSVVS